jgi:hypothetical protein
MDNQQEFHAMIPKRDTIENGLLCAALCGPEFVAEIQARTQPRPIRDVSRAAYWAILERRAERGEPFDLDTIMRRGVLQANWNWR